MEEIKFNVGDVVKDSITGYKGVVVGITEWLYQCRRLGLQSQELDKDGQPKDVQWFDELQCEPVAKGNSLRIAEDEDTGGPMPAPTRRVDPGAR